MYKFSSPCDGQLNLDFDRLSLPLDARVRLGEPASDDATSLSIHAPAGVDLASPFNNSAAIGPNDVIHFYLLSKPTSLSIRYLELILDLRRMIKVLCPQRRWPYQKRPMVNGLLSGITIPLCFSGTYRGRNAVILDRYDVPEEILSHTYANS